MPAFTCPAAESPDNAETLKKLSFGNPLHFLMYLFFVRRKHLFLEQAPHLAVYRMRDILIGAIGALFRGHTEKKSLVAIDDFHSPDNKSVVESHVSEGLQLILVTQRQPDFSNLQNSSRR